MLNRKQICESSRTCETGKTFQGTSSFFLMPNYNNRYDPRFVNSRTNVVNGTNGVGNLNTNRVGAELCSNDTKQKRLSLRRKPTPYRVPFNHYRKTYNCKDISLDLEQFLFTHLLIEDPYFDYDDENDYENNIDNTIYESDL